MTQTFQHPFAIAVEHSRTDEFKQLLVKLVADPISNKISKEHSTINQSINQPSLSAFSQAAILLRQGIKQIEALIETQRKPYLNVHRYLSSNQSDNQMTEEDRDQLESTVAAFVLEYKSKIEDLAASIQDEQLKFPSDDELFDQPVTKDLIEHQHAVCQSLLNQLKHVTESIHSMKQFRINQMREEVEANKTRAFNAKYSLPKRNQSNEHSRSSSLDQATNQSASHLADFQNSQMTEQSANQTIDLSDPVQAQLLQENAALLRSFEGDLDAIQQAESKAHDIANMITLFHTKVLEQSEQIDRIDSQTIESTSMIENGIEQLRRAAGRGASFRMMILFVIVVLSFSLLFLDWYST